MFPETAAIAILILIASGKRIVIDNSSPKDPYVSQYCQLSHLCPFRGSHVFCLTLPYGYGPACHDVNEGAVMRVDLAFRILAIFNGMRSKIAMGTEMWRSFVASMDRPFPRGYGIWKLEWDSELATFAQMWANQCLDQSEGISYDFCHASRRFPFATQIVGEVTERRMSADNIAPIIISLIRSHFYSPAKTSTSIDVSVLKWCLKKCGDPTDWSYKYLQIINGANTHVGCGISISKTMNGQRQRLKLVCNFSHQTRHFTSLYPLEFPKSNSNIVYTQCGCPPNAYETPDCLCKAKKSRCTGSKCSPSVLVLPVVAFEEKAVTLE